ncbi:hypothetical protein [Kitasatospora sp. NPDC086791]|uniref:hypothetical protein n=1 Tax=Kitasatospora sp. NPDC086791 TaxID=3155178 RepID=UPI003415C086
MTTSTDVLRFALRQGPLRGLLHTPVEVDERVPTTALLPPAAARTDRGRPLPSTAHTLSAGAEYPAGRLSPDGPDLLGRVLATAFGVLRREPSNPANDHRVTASVRSKFPVHVLVVPPGADHPGYLDPYRHALVDLALDAPVLAGPVAALRPAAGDAVVLLAARHTDLPTAYGALRCALGDLETGIQLRSLLVTAELFGVRASVATTGPAVSAAAELNAATGPGSWGAPVVVVLHGVGAPAGSADLDPAGGGADAAGDERLRVESLHPSLAECAVAIRPRLERPRPERPHGLGPGPAETTGPAIPALPAPPGGGPGWERVWWNRSAGRVPAPLSGFSARPVTRGEDCLRDLLAWSAVPAPDGPLREVAERVRLTLVPQGLAGLPVGRYGVSDGRLTARALDPTLPRRIEQGFGYPLSATNDCGVRHALAVLVLSADLGSIVRDLGPAAWGLLQVWCGWAAHGVSLAAAAHDLFARPARSYDEHHLSALLDLPRQESPVLLLVCGKSRYTEPALDLRT